MNKKDTSREDSLYHLLLVLARIQNSNPATKNQDISESLRTLKVEKSETNYVVEIDYRHRKRSVTRPVQEFKFYDTKSDQSIAHRNKNNALALLNELLPEAFAGNTQTNLKKRKIVFSETITVLYLVLCLFSLLSNYGMIASMALSLGTVGLPVWIFLANFTFATRVIVSISSSFIFYFGNQLSKLDPESVAILLFTGLALTSRKYNSGLKERLFWLLFISVMIIPFYTGEGRMATFLCSALLIVNTVSSILFKTQKSFGAILLAVLSIALFVTFLDQSKIELTEQITNLPISIVWFSFVFYTYSVSGSLVGPTKFLVPIFSPFFSYDFNYAYAVAPLILVSLFMKAGSFVSSRKKRDGI